VTRVGRRVEAREVREGDTLLDDDGKAWRVTNVVESPEGSTWVLYVGDPPATWTKGPTDLVLRIQTPERRLT